MSNHIHINLVEGSGRPEGILQGLGWKYIPKQPMGSGDHWRAPRGGQFKFYDRGRHRSFQAIGSTAASSWGRKDAEDFEQAVDAFRDAGVSTQNYTPGFVHINYESTGAKANLAEGYAEGAWTEAKNGDMYLDTDKGWYVYFYKQSRLTFEPNKASKAKGVGEKRWNGTDPHMVVRTAERHGQSLSERVENTGAMGAIDDEWHHLFRALGMDPWTLANGPNADNNPKVQRVIKMAAEYLGGKEKLRQYGISRGDAGPGSELLMGVQELIG